MTNKISKKVFGAIFWIKFYAFLTTITPLFNINVYLKKCSEGFSNCSISKNNNLPIVITNDNHYVDKHDHEAHELLMCLQTNSNINDPNRFKLDDDNYYIKSTEEMWNEWSEIPSGLSNTLEIINNPALNILNIF